MALILRFSGSRSLESLAVKAYTWSWASHCETVLLRNGNHVLYGALPSTGVNYRPYDSTAGEHVEEYKIQMTTDVTDQVTQNLLSQQGKPYDYTAILAFAMHRNWGDDHAKWFCSELIVWAFAKANFSILRTEHLNRVSPRDLLLSPYLVKVNQ